MENKINLLTIRTVIVIICLSIVFSIARICKRNSYVSELGVRDTLSTTKIGKIDIAGYKSDSILIINQKSEDFIVFLTDSCSEGARYYSITKDGISPLVYLAVEYENSEIKTIYYSKEGTKLISIEK